jgi:hypothetical protein
MYGSNPDEDYPPEQQRRTWGELVSKKRQDLAHTPGRSWVDFGKKIIERGGKYKKHARKSKRARKSKKTRTHRRKTTKRK